ncbi:hypothetical protein RUM43_013510 [Polyplax serrata]|uniref:Uncharacterized protein n=1 Tax=Polyplax serrata TaxID=468196 RepID=A0AAN8Q2V3_POLSC
MKKKDGNTKEKTPGKADEMKKVRTSGRKRRKKRFWQIKEDKCNRDVGETWQEEEEKISLDGCLRVVGVVLTGPAGDLKDLNKQNNAVINQRE